MPNGTIETAVTGGQIQGVAGAGTVVIENFTIYNRAVEEPTATDTAGEPIPPCPYPGLAYFGPQDADLFFGRDAAIARLEEAVGRQSLTALVGASGSGKSSVVLAGLAPRLYAAGRRRFAHFRIGTELDSNPFLALSRALVPLYVDSQSDTNRLSETRQLATRLQAGELTLQDVFADCRSRDKGTRILLIADQFEEAFTLVEDEAILHRFIDVLLAGFPDPAPGSSPDICLILTLRADFYGRALRHRPLADALQGHVENLGPMNRQELQAAIRLPAESVNVSFEPGLVETLVDDVESKPGSLPLLQFALREMWGRQEQRKIAHKGYDDIGGVEGALAQRAETIFAAMTENGANPQMLQAFQRLFTRLVTPGEGQEDTRRVVDRRELGDDVWSLAQRLASEDNRLVVTNAAFSRETAEVVHEALIRHWPKLVDWIDRDRVFQSWLRQIRSNVELWSTDPSDDGPLLRGGMLAQGRDWIARRRDDLSPTEQRYIEASLALQRRDEEEREATRQAEIKRQRELAEAERRAREAAEARAATEEQARRIAETARQKLRQRLIVAATSVSVALAALLWAALEWSMSAQHAIQAQAASKDAEAQRKIAEDEKKFAEQQQNQRLLEESSVLSRWSEETSAAGDGTTGMLIALEALPPPAFGRARPVSPAAAMALYQAWLRNRETTLLARGEFATDAAIAPDGHHAVSASGPALRIWDFSRQPITSRQSPPLDGYIAAVDYGPNGPMAVTVNREGQSRLWEWSGDQLTWQPLKGQAARVTSAKFSWDRRHMVTTASDGAARVWDLGVDPPESREIRDARGRIATAAVSADGRYVATVSWGAGAGVWDLSRDPPTLRPIDQPASEGAIAISPDGTRVVTPSRNGMAWLWDLSTQAAIPVAMKGHYDYIRSAAFSRDGRRVVTASLDRTARVWDLSTQPPTSVVLKGSAGILTSAAFSADGTAVITSSGVSKPGSDGVVRVWDLGEDRPVSRVLRSSLSKITAAVFARHGERVITLGSDRSLRLWDLTGDRPTSQPLEGADGAVYTWFSGNGRWVLTVPRVGSARLWELSTIESRDLPDLGGQAVLAVSDDGHRVLLKANAAGGAVSLWDLSRDPPITRSLGAPSGSITSATFSSDGSRFAATSGSNCGDSTASLWDVSQAEPTAVNLRAPGDQGCVMSVAFSKNGRRLVVVWGASLIDVWDLAGKQPRRDETLRSGSQFNFAVFGPDPDGNRLLTTSFDGLAQLWDLSERPAHPVVLQGPLGSVTSGSLSPSGQQIVTALADGSAELWWDLQSGRPVSALLEGHTDAIRAATFSADGRSVLTLSEDGTARLWPAMPDIPELIRRVESSLGRCLSFAQRAAFGLTIEGDPPRENEVPAPDSSGRCPR
jgi:WD40 repeat protein